MGKTSSCGACSTAAAEVRASIRKYLADTGYSIGEVYAYLESKSVKGYIRLYSTYKKGPDNFDFVKNKYHYNYLNGGVVPFQKSVLVTIAYKS
ncbi:hypothetical protein ACWGOQ_0011180 [Aquimarina sp. M1]